MAEVTKIQWCHHTFNPWRGCTKVSAGCANCYAEAQSKRNPAILGIWGDSGTRVVAADAYWRQPAKWDRAAARAGERRRVFCASLADVFEDRPELDATRYRLFDVIRSTPALDWLLLTKRPHNLAPMFGQLRARGFASSARFPWSNVWLGTSVEDQATADERIPHLLAAPAAVRFLSCEPLLEPLSLTHEPGKPCAPGRLLAKVDWVIVGGESGPHARPFDLAWARSIRDQCRAAGTAFFLKQLGARPMEAIAPGHGRGMANLAFDDKKGGDPDEWPEDLRIREFPTIADTTPSPAA